MRVNKHKNEITKEYRYKKFEVNTQKYIGIQMFPSTLGLYYSQSFKGIKYVFFKHDYKPYFIFKYLWSFINWNKRPKLKNIKEKPIISNIFKFLSKFIIEFLIAIIISIILLLYGNEIKEMLK
ncbi:hypothetical protein [Polaribacter sp. IC063]|uniref:hypothetical protein n=1 Tax=Polaribacter sp. IC063 TaxID=57031 RepID=UPI0011BED5AA|nr:hypothetical protein [Polaribacter sp. IC063]TXD47371.1 hypothetical protein ES043_18305 [Polaribacter sp. IC063]